MSSISRSTTAALGCTALLAPAALQAFVAPSPGATTGNSQALRGVSQAVSSASQETSSGHAYVATALGTAAVAAAVSGSRRGQRKAAVVRLAEATGATSEKPFAGGLIGGESAFSGQDFNFDPLGLSVKCEKYLPWFREAELKHGRIAMLAWVGLVVPEFVRVPGPDSGSAAACYQASNVVEAHNACVGNPPFPFTTAVWDGSGFFGGAEGEAMQAGPLFQIYAWIAAVEMLTSFPKFLGISNKPGLTLQNAGDYRLGLNFLPKDPMKAKEMRLKELKNGRLAMLAFGGAITQATLTGNGFPWLYAQKEQNSAGLSSSLGGAGNSFAAGNAAGSSRSVARHAESKGYKMSAAVPFLPVSPALEGYVGEEDGFDPMGFSLAYDIKWLREAELKHARVAMLATVGWISTDLGMRVPGDAFQVSTIEAHDAMVKFGAMPQMLVWLGLLEVFGFLAYNKMAEGYTDRKPGDFGLRVFYPSDEKGQYDMQLKELRNGRLAMLAFSGIATVGVLTQDRWPFFPTQAIRDSTRRQVGGARFCGATSATPCRASTACQAMERSHSMPFLPKPKNLDGLVGAEAQFDPLGFSDTFDVKWLREAELKHCRVCMLATLGFVAEQYIQFPGMKGSEDALQAFWTAPAGATGLLIFIAGYLESSAYGGKITMLDMFEGEGAKRAPGDLNFGKSFLPSDPKEAEDLAMKELANGRLAMLAFSGMVHHNLVVKGPLFPLIPDGWTGPQGSWDLNSVAGQLNSAQAGL
eukprot:TRINITY_DN1152_c0_g1_i4.p1 TRINITY_DN1152_c0_g1~~TRINITY_DN1152_c0_g1_i4.p1  ORF type:complete len:752 (-),score=191.60 TRINITY_DN1152_c0_g1_i4:354-2609(-)